MSLRFALLGLLASESCSGYDLTRRFSAGIGSFAWSARHSQIYPELNKLDAEGLVSAREAGARGRKVYDITPLGRRAVHDWLLSPPSDRGTVRNEFVLRLFLLSVLEDDEALGLLARVEGTALEQLAVLEREQADLPPGSGPALAAAYGVYSYAAVRDWARSAAGQVRARGGAATGKQS